MVVKKGDVVTVISGDYKGKQGTVIKVITKTNEIKKCSKKRDSIWVPLAHFK